MPFTYHGMKNDTKSNTAWIPADTVIYTTSRTTMNSYTKLAKWHKNQQSFYKTMFVFIPV